MSTNLNFSGSFHRFLKLFLMKWLISATNSHYIFKTFWIILVVKWSLNSTFFLVFIFFSFEINILVWYIYIYVFSLYNIDIFFSLFCTFISFFCSIWVLQAFSYFFRFLFCFRIFADFRFALFREYYCSQSGMLIFEVFFLLLIEHMSL